MQFANSKFFNSEENARNFQKDKKREGFTTKIGKTRKKDKLPGKYAVLYWKK